MEEKTKVEQAKPKAKSKATIRVAHGGVDAWNELFEYVEHVVLGLPENMRMSNTYVLRLEGLSKGNFMANKDIKPMALYQYEDMLTAYKVANALIKFKTDFKDETHRFNYATTIVEKKINDIARKRISKQKANEKLENAVLGNQVYDGVKFEDKKDESPKRKNNPLLDNLW